MRTSLRLSRLLEPDVSQPLRSITLETTVGSLSRPSTSISNEIRTRTRSAPTSLRRVLELAAEPTITEAQLEPHGPRLLKGVRRRPRLSRVATLEVLLITHSSKSPRLKAVVALVPAPRVALEHLAPPKTRLSRLSFEGAPKAVRVPVGSYPTLQRRIRSSRGPVAVAAPTSGTRTCSGCRQASVQSRGPRPNSRKLVHSSLRTKAVA